MDCMRSSFNEGIVLHGRYETISPLNHGSFGMVFVARDTFTGELVAIKCLTKKVTNNNACLPAFSVDEKSEELTFHTMLSSHPHIVNLVDSFETEAHTYLVLEFCSNGDLYEAIRLGRGPLETEHVRDFMLQLVDAVAFVHSRGLYHRDIKPENIFLTQSGAMKLGDFGLATTESWTFESTVGSDRYMAPEQYDPAGIGYSPEQADVWAIGICILNILFSRNPFVVPTESDPLFADFVRDPQSMFDIFPTMSQDTFEVLLQSLSLDPSRRSLQGIRNAINRVISFTTDDELLDEFCVDDNEAVPPTANREPLRTPSITSPQLDQGGAFPWAKALHLSPPQQIRQLSVIHDTETYSEDLFGDSVTGKSDWGSVDPANASVASAFDSALGTSLKSLPVHQSKDQSVLRSSPMPISGSVPLPSMAMVFGKKSEVVSKSWCDLWDEEEEAEHTPAVSSVQGRTLNSRSWSQESDHDVTIRRIALSEQPNSTVNTKTQPEVRDTGVSGIGIDGVNENDGFFFEDHHAPGSSPPRYSPPARRSIMDKWSALGEKRRAYNGQKAKSTTALVKSSSADNSAVVSPFSSSFSKRRAYGGAFGYGSTWDRKERGVVRRWSRDRRDDGMVGDFEWVGGWHDLHL